MCRKLILLLVAVCVFQSVTSGKVEKIKAKEAVVEAAAAEDQIEEEKRDLNEEADSDEDLSEELPAHPVYEEVSPALQELIVRSRRPNCSDRKCLRWYRGWWAAECDFPARAVTFCKKTNKWCCAQSKPKKQCIDKGGFCGLYAQCPPEMDYWRRGCQGRFGCCSP